MAQVPAPLDDLDTAIVATLAADGRLSNRELAARVGVSESTSLQRTRSLIERGVITGFHADVDPASLGLGLQALISVSLRAGARHTIASFFDEMRALPDVLQVFFLGGAEDFILHVAARDSDHIRDFVVGNLSAHPGVASTRTSLLFEHHRAQPGAGHPSSG